MLILVTAGFIGFLTYGPIGSIIAVIVTWIGAFFMNYADHGN